MSYKDLVYIANKLDKIGMNKDADFIDSLLEKMATKTGYLEQVIIDRINKTIFYIPHGIRQSLDTKESYFPYMMFGEELEEHREKLKYLESLHVAAKQKYQRLVDELLAFIADDPKLSLIDVNKLTNTSYEEDQAFSDGPLSMIGVSSSFLWTLKNGFSYGYNPILKEDFFRISTSKEVYKEKVDKTIDVFKENFSKIPEDLEDLMQKENISSKKELAEALYYVANGITGSVIKVRGIENAPISPISSRVGNVTLSTILRAGREFVKIRARKYDRNKYNYQFEQREEDISYWPREPEEPAKNEPEYITRIYDKAEHAKYFIDNYIDKFFYKIYEKTGKKSFSAIHSFLNEILDKYLEEKFNPIKKIFSAYNFNERDFEIYKQNYKERLLAEYNSSYQPGGTPPFAKLYHNSLDPNRGILELDLLFNAYPKAENLFKEKAKKYFNTIDFSSIKEASIDIVQIVAKIDEEIARDLEAGNFDLYSKILVYLRDAKIGKEDIESKKSILLSDIYDLFPEAISYTGNKSHYLKEPEAIRKLIAGSRLSRDGVIGFRDFRKTLNPTSLTNVFMVKSDVIYARNEHSQEPSPESIKLREIEEKIDNLAYLAYRYDKAIESAKNQDEKAAIKKEWTERYRARLDEANNAANKIKINANYYNTENSEQILYLVRELAPKVLYKIYAEEEEFMTGKRDEVYDISDRIAKKNGIKNITELLFQNINAGISLPGRIRELLSASDNELIKLYFAFSSPNEMNSIERMHSFLIKLLKFHIDSLGDNRYYSLSYLEKRKIDFQDFISKFSGTKNEKIEKILSVVNLADNNVFISHSILQSKYVDKMDLNIFEKAIDAFLSIERIRQFSGEADVISYINKKRLNLVNSLGEESAEKIISSRFIKAIEEVHNIKELDDFIEYLGLDSFSFDETAFLNIKQKLAILNQGLSVLTQIYALSEYYAKAKPKNKSLFKGNMTTESFRFRVLEDLDPYHFQVGVDTDCCQVIGGAGEEAAIDSFINPLAGVILLEIKNKGEWILAAQSYFHYVPEKEIIILDNIEAAPNRDLIKSIKEITGYSFAEMYFALAKHLQSQGINEVLVGKEYTSVISKHEFEKDSRKKDPRSFSVKEPYSDYSSKNSYNILSPKFEMKELPNIINGEPVTASYKSIMIKLAAFGSAKIDSRGRKIISLSTLLLRDGFVKEAKEVLDIFQ